MLAMGHIYENTNNKKHTKGVPTEAKWEIWDSTTGNFLPVAASLVQHTPLPYTAPEKKALHRLSMVQEQLRTELYEDGQRASTSRPSPSHQGDAAQLPGQSTAAETAAEHHGTSTSSSSSGGHHRSGSWWPWLWGYNSGSSSRNTSTTTHTDLRSKNQRSPGARPPPSRKPPRPTANPPSTANPGDATGSVRVVVVR